MNVYKCQVLHLISTDPDAHPLRTRSLLAEPRLVVRAEPPRAKTTAVSTADLPLPLEPDRKLRRGLGTYVKSCGGGEKGRRE